MACADVAPEHKGGRAIRPALKDVWTARFLADRMQVQSFDQFQYMVLVRRIAQTNLEPLRLWQLRLRVVSDYV